MISSRENGNDEATPGHSDFSIDHILNRAGTTSTASGIMMDQFSWLNCTRYCPPKIPRRREGPQRRQLGRHPRIPFTTHQLSILEEKFQKSAYLSSEEVIRLSQQLDLADVRVKIWFQNRRARERREKSTMPQPTESVAIENGNRIAIKQEQSDSSSEPSTTNYSTIFHANRLELFNVSLAGFVPAVQAISLRKSDQP